MNKNFKVDYFSRDFASLKQDLKNYARRYYKDTLADLSEASINSFIIDSIAYAGDVLSYYLDYQTNESFLPTATENKNILNLAKSLGYKKRNSATTTGRVSVYILIPADSTGYSPDFSKIPIILKGTQLSSQNGGKFLTSEDLVIDQESIGDSYFSARVNNLGRTTHFAVKSSVPVVSGLISEESYSIGEFVKFNKIILNNINAVEIISVTDLENNTYYEVPNLSQNVVYKSVISADNEHKYSLKPISAQRRFIFDIDENNLPFLMFGAKQYRPDDDLTIDPISEPNKFALNKYNTEYLQDNFFEPNVLINGDMYGIAPENTTLFVKYRYVTSNDGCAIGDLRTVDRVLSQFNNSSMSESEKSSIVSSIEVTNEEAIVGNNTDLNIEEIRDLSTKIYAAQGRAVTSTDYETLCFMMPAKFGSIKRVKVMRDPTSLKNNINIYIISENSSGKLIKSNTRIKENLKTWLSEYKIITDTVDILDAKVINFGITYDLMLDPTSDKIQAMTDIKNSLITLFSMAPSINEPFDIISVYKEIRKNTNVLDIKNIKISNLTSADYSSLPYNIEENTTPDGNFIKIPKNAIWEIKYPDLDITGNFI